MPTRNVVLTDHQSKLIDEWVAEGRYQNASEALRDGLRLVERQHATHLAKIAALRAAVQEGIDDADAGRYTSFDSFDDLRAHLEGVVDEAIAEVTEEA